MGLQIRVERLLGELHEVRGQTQALELSLLIVASVVRIGHGSAFPSREMSGRTPTRLLSVVQTTEPKSPPPNWLGVRQVSYFAQTVRRKAARLD
jgi:hypothetical protein